MTIPKIIFKYSWIYDKNWKKWIKIYRKENQKYPSAKQIQNYIKKVENLWSTDEKKILTALQNITSLKWKSKYIQCYIVGRCIPFSDPLTLSVYDKKPDRFIDTLIHELIHQLFTQNGNFEQSKEAWNYIRRKYKDESHRVKTHIPLFAIYSYLYMNFYGEKRLRMSVKPIISMVNYKKAWDIVQKEGYQNIIKQFKKRIN